MNANREEALFALALEKPAAKRAAFLDAVCEGDSALRTRLEALLTAHEEPDDSLPTDGPAARATIKLDLSAVPDEAVGQFIGRYKVLQKIGEGGCGAVYMAEQQEPVRRRVALKVIKLGMDTKAVIARFEAERQALALMDHPNIAKVLDAGATDAGRPFFVMELVRGIKFTEYCDQNHLDTRTRLELFIQICQAIQHAHQKGIIHRDIKPSNILVTLHDGVPVPKVIDFGIAKATTDQRLTEKTLFTAYEQFIGTPAYMSPEQAEMSGLDIDTRSDIYSLGVLLYELLTGSTPFDAQELMSQGIDAMRKTIREKEPVRPSTRLATLRGDELTTTAKRRSVEAAKLTKLLRGDLDWIVMKCLEKDRTRRYETANGLAFDLKRHLNNEPVLARPPSKLYEFQKTVRRHKVGFAATAAIIVVLAVGVSVSTWQAARATRARIAADASRWDAQANEAKARSAEASAAAQRDLAQDRLLDSLIREMRSTATLRPAGYRSILRERVHQSLELPRSSQRRDELRAEFTQALGDPVGLDPVLIRWETNQPRVFRMALTSDGELAAIWTDEGGLEIRDTATGKRMAKLGLEDPLGDLAFSPDGRTLFGRVLDFNSPVAQLHEWRHGSGGSWTPRVHGTVVVNRFLRTPKAVFALVRKAPGEFELVNLETQERLTAFQLGPRQLPRALAVSDDGWIACGVENDVNRNSAVIEVWRPDNAKPRIRLDNLPGMGSLVGAGFSPDGRLLVCAGESGLVVYEIPGFKIIKKHFVYLGTTPYPPAFVGDGSIVAVSLNQQSGIRLLDLTSQTDTLINTPESMPWLTASMDGTTLAGINQKGIRFFRLTDTPERRRLAGHIGGVPAVEFSPDGRLIASTGKDGTIRFWEADSGNSWRVLRQENAVGQSVAFSPDGRWLASADYYHDQIRIWSVKTGTQALTLGQLQRGSGQVWGCGFSPDGRHLVGVGNSLRIWKISDAATNNGLEAELIVEQPGRFRNLLFDPRRPAIAFSGFIDPGEGLRAFVRGLGPKDELKFVGTRTSGLVQAIGMTPDTGELILSDPYPNRQTLHFWNPDTRTEIRTIQALMPGEAQTGGAGNLRVSPDGKKLAIANQTGRRVNIHDVATGRRLYSLPDEPGVIWWLAWHPDSRRLAVSRDHGDISIWKLDAVEAALAEVGLTP